MLQVGCGSGGAGWTVPLTEVRVRQRVAGVVTRHAVGGWAVCSHIYLAMAKLHVEFGPRILALAKRAPQTGEPIVKPMAMAFPEGGYEWIDDQFVLGDDLIVAPVVRRGDARARWSCRQGVGRRTMDGSSREAERFSSRSPLGAFLFSVVCPEGGSRITNWLNSAHAALGTGANPAPARTQAKA